MFAEQNDERAGGMSHEQRYPLYYSFRQFHSDNPHIYREITRRAQAVHAAGGRRFGIAAIFESMRFDVTIKTLSAEYGLPNNYKAYYVRQLVRDYPDLAKMFKLVPCLADEAMATA